MKVFSVSKNERLVIGSGSSGCQPKWFRDGFYIKLSVLGYEHVAEVITSEFLSLCDLRGFKYVKYHICDIYEDGIYRGQGCYSKSFLDEEEYEVSASDIIAKTASSYAIGYEDFIDLAYGFTGLWCKEYINMMLAIDAIVKNDDRHFRNISFTHYQSETYEYAPCYSYAPFYDFGAGLLSDIFTHPMEVDVRHCLKSVYAKPFSVTFGKDIKDFMPIVVDLDGVHKLQEALKGNPYTERAMQVLIIGLGETEGKLWVRS